MERRSGSRLTSWLLVEADLRLYSCFFTISILFLVIVSIFDINVHSLLGAEEVVLPKFNSLLECLER